MAFADARHARCHEAQQTARTRQSTHVAGGSLIAITPDSSSTRSYDLAFAPSELPNRRSLRQGVRAALDSGRQRIVIDCRSWQELDLPLLSVLVQCARDCRRLGASFEMTNLPPHIRADIDALRLSERLGLN
jgi:hypothetical protein